jgi:erythronate-4-phosphate dehydrogenase
MRVVCDDKVPFLKGVLEPFAEVVYLPGGKISPADVADADALIVRTRTQCNQALLGDSKVRHITTATIGYDHIDTQWCHTRGIAWTNAPGCNSGSVRQYLASVLVTLSRRYGFGLEHKTLGVVGVGNVGSKVARMARALGMRVLMNDPPRAEREGPEAFVSLDVLLREADIITLHVPLEHSGPFRTFHLFDASVLASLRQGAFLINSSRGEVVDNQALLNTLNTGYLAAAVLDVWEHEPDILPPLLDRVALSTPHIAGYSADGKANGTAACVRYLASQYGWPLADWYPSQVPPPPEGLEVILDTAGKTVAQVVAEAILHTYDVSGDDARLRQAPGQFEQLRGAYPVRREFEAYTIILKGGTVCQEYVLKNLGFHVQSQ